MKYMLLIYDNADTREEFPGEDGAALMAEVDALMEELTESGELIGGEALADPSNTKTVRARDGVPAITDGPLAEAKEHFGGYLHRRLRDARARDRDRRPLAERALRARWRCARSWTAPGRRCERRDAASRTCCARSRRRSSARSCAATGDFDACEDAVQEALLAAARAVAGARACPTTRAPG